MAELGKVIDSDKVEPNSFAPFPAGKYDAMIEEAEVKPTKDGNGAGLNIKFEILNDGPGLGRKLFKWINLENKNAECVKIGEGELSAVARACGIGRFSNTDQIVGKQVKIEVGMGKDLNGNACNVVKEVVWKKPGQVGGSSASATGGVAGNKDDDIPF